MPSGEPWRVLRVVVEVRVPPKTPADEKDLLNALREFLPRSVLLPRPQHPRRQEGVIRTKSFASFWPAHARMQGWRKPVTIHVPVTAGGAVEED